MVKSIRSKFKKKIKTHKDDKIDDSHPRKGFSLRKRPSQISNTTLAERIIGGLVSVNTLVDVQNKKEMNYFLGKHSDVSIEKYIIRCVRDQRKLRQQKKDKNKRGGLTNQERSIITKLKKEPEKNKTHWDNLLTEMKWMQADFDKERKNKKKVANLFVKYTNKSIETKQIETIKAIKRQEANLQKKYLIISRCIKGYWQKIEKLVKYNYNLQLDEEKIQLQQNRLMGFINKLQKISGKVANSLDPGVNKKLMETSSVFYSDLIPLNNKNSTEEEINILLKKNSDGTYSILENNLDENLVAKAAHFAEQLQPKGTQLKEANITLQQPFLLQNILREYQLIGLHWLIALHDNHINGILADEMGLGKTIQTIALFAYLAAHRGNWGCHLIIVPTTIIVNWEIEFKKWCPSLKILSYYGNQKERKAKRYGWHKPNSFHVCITSYKLVIQDYSIFKRKRWYYIVLDEAQNIKNFKSKRWQMLLNFKAKRKLLLTGTPLQNDIMEIWSYLHFLMPNLFYSNEEFREWFHSQFYNAIHNNASLNKQIISSLHSILRPFLLRRLKKDVEKQLPEKIEHVVYCELSRRQKYLYDEYINTDITQDTLKRNDYFSIMNVLMQLRKVCNHPDLFDSRDYNTSSRIKFEIVYECPSMIAGLFDYNPMKSLNYKEMHLIITDNERFSYNDYILMIQYFPDVPIFELYDEIINNKTQLYTPKYLIDENDILFKKNYADASILRRSNTDTIRSSLSIMQISNMIKGDKINNASLNGNIGINPNQEETNKENQSNVSHFNLPFPNHLTPTNIPLLQNSSMNNYFDMFYPIDTSEPVDEQSYVKSVFNDYLMSKKMKMHLQKKKLLHTYDIKSRQEIVMSKPIFGRDGMKAMKINFFMDLANSPLLKMHILYGKDNQGQRTVLNTCLNKGFKYIANENTIANLRENEITKISEGYDEEDRAEEEEAKRKKEEEDELKRKIEVEDNADNINNEANQQITIGLNDNINMNESDHVNQMTNKEEANKINQIQYTIIDISKKKAKHINDIKDRFTSETDIKLTSKDTIFPTHSKYIHEMIYTPQKFLSLSEEVMTYFRIFIPQVITCGPKLVLSKVNTRYRKIVRDYQTLYNNLHRIPNVVKYLSLFKIMSCPDRKLVEYDSGKLIKLSRLLKTLYRNKSKALIFTQMTRMLDILEIFLNIHGFTYVRLDGSTKVELRQQIVDKFNTDPKVFCFISSTRSGGIGLNLTGADSIIFFDTDWNPAMDKQAQDRCHRIGQTRTVHIYRLITLGTIEENIFKKSIQKRELNYVVMEEGKFNTENVSKLNLKKIIYEEKLIKPTAEDPEEQKVVRRKPEDKIKKLLEFENLKFENEEEQKNIEEMLIKIEDQEDVQALKNLSKEMLDEYQKEHNELQFFKEDDKNDTLKDIREKEQMDKLKPIDKFALRFIREEYSYRQFVKDKESKMNTTYGLSDNESNNEGGEEDDDLDLGESESDNDSVNKMDIDRAYDLYLKKKKEIMKMFEAIESEEQEQAKGQEEL